MGIATAPEILGKTPDEVVNRTMDFGDKLDSDETLSSLSADDVTITPSGAVETGTHLTLTSHSISGQVATLKLSGGIAGTRYTVLVHATTSAEEEVEGRGYMSVEDA